MAVSIETLGIAVDSRQVKTAAGDLDKLSASSGKAEKSTISLSGAVTALAGSYAALKVVQYAKDAAMMAARYETLGVVMRTVGNNAGYTGSQMEQFAKGLQKSGIAMIESRATITRMAQANIDLSKSLELARIAQDAAVIGNINSSEAFERMIHGIQSGQIEILRTIGISVNFEKSYAKLGAQLGKSAKDLTELEKMQARTNVVMEAGTGIAGTYEAAMGTAGKQILSMKRYWDDLKVSVGGALLEEMTTGTKEVTASVKELSEYLKQEDVQQSIKDTAAGLAAIARAMLAIAKAAPKAGEMLGLNIIGKAMAFNRSANKFAISAYESATGKIDPNTGLPVGVPSDMTLAQGHGQSNRMPITLSPGHASSPVVEPATPKTAEELERERKKAEAEYKNALSEQSKLLENKAEMMEETLALTAELELATLSKDEKALFGIKKEYEALEQKNRLFTLMGQQTQEEEARKSAAYAERMGEENLELLNKQEDAAYAYNSALEEMGATGKSVAEDLNDAFTGWASNMSKDFNDVLWGAKVTFNGILESFGKMITQMYIQKQILEPAMGALDAAGGIGGIIGSWLGGSSGGTPAAFSQVSAYDSMVGTSTDFAFAGGGVIAEPVVGMGLSSGKSYSFGENGPEAVLNKSQIGGSQQGQNLNVEVNVINQSGQEVNAKVGPTSFNLRGAVVNVILEDVEQNGPLRGLFAGAGAY